MLRAIPNKREFLARSLGRLGLLDLFERTFAKRRPGLIVLTHHRIAEPGADHFYDPVISATPESFRAQVEWLHNRVRLLTFDELVAQINSNEPWREPVMLLTFDDGYRDNFDCAAPILQERHLPATFFIPTGFLDRPQLPWWDHVACVLKQTQVPRLVLERTFDRRGAPLELDLRSVSRATAIATVIGAFLDDTIGDPSWFLDQLTDCAQVDVDAESLGRQLFMSWEQVRHLGGRGTGFSIGSHAHSHCKLAALDENAQLNELTLSKQILEDRLGTPVRALAYPYGWLGTYTAKTVSLAAQASYQVAFSSREGINRPGEFDRHEIRRLGVGSADSAVLLRARSTLHGAFGKSFL